ncbi:lipase member H [Caerostris darwini]|uniref:Lipase member H n=1 Tax=Caerostris darwini TaxID=1538125 RepID=A0AAV4VKI3_9ARAC|nr:lipase member H [Caerostris darwini]
MLMVWHGGSRELLTWKIFRRGANTMHEQQQGYGIYDPLGDIDFYPNGGAKQPQCESVEDSSEYISCNHDAAPYFFLQSINTTQCLFRSVQCPIYDDFLDGQCPPDSSATDLMGLPAQKIPCLAPKSKFYLRTMEDSPYCLQDGDGPA